MNRRDFFKSVGLACAGIAALPLMAKAQERRRGGGTAPAASGPVLVDPNSPEAKALSYQTSHSKIKDAKLKVEKDGVAWEKQSCSTCILFQGKKGDKQAGCAVFPGKEVSAGAWCTSWSLKKS